MAIASPATVKALNDVLAASASLTGPASADTALQAVIYQANGDGTYALVDPSAFLSSPISVPSGSTTAGFQLKYQALSPPGNYVVSVVTASAASRVSDLGQLPLTTFAPFAVQAPPVAPSPPPSDQPAKIASVAIAPPATVTTLGDALAVSVSLTGPATTLTGLQAILYQALDNGSYSPIDQSAFSVPSISVAAGGTNTSFQLTYQKALPAGNYAVSVVTASDASQVADVTHLPVVTFASFTIVDQVGGQTSPPTTVAAAVIISGTLNILQASGSTPASGAAVIAMSADGSGLANTSTDAAGNFSLSVPTGGVPFDGYLHLIVLNLIHSRLYVSPALVSDVQLGNIFVCSGTVLNGFATLLGLQDAPQSTVVTVVRDSSLTAIQGADVSLKQNGLDVGTLFASPAIAQPTALGTFDGSTWAFNVPSGMTDTEATASGALLGQAQINTFDKLTFVLLIADQQTQPQTSPPPPQAVGIAAVSITPPTFVASPGDALSVTVSLTGTAPADIGVDAVVYQALGGATYAPIDQSVFLYPPTKVMAGDATVSFPLTYQKAFLPGSYVVSVVTADDASQVSDVTNLPVVTFAPFTIQAEPTTPPLAGQDFTVGGQPIALSFDGTAIWVGTQADNSVWVLSASDGSLMRRILITGTPYAMAAAAHSTWIASAASAGQGYLIEANADGIIRTFPLQLEPMSLIAIQYDGIPDPALFFIDAAGQSLFRFDPGTGQAFAVASVNTGGAEWDLWDLLFDGTSIWISNAGNDTVLEMDSSGVHLLNTLPAGGGPGAMAFDGSFLWVANYQSNTVSRLQVPTSPANLNWSPAGTVPTGTNPGWIAFDGANIWVTNMGDNTMTQIRASDATVLATQRTGPGPAGVLFDGTYIWVANSGSNTVTRYLPNATS